MIGLDTNVLVRYLTEDDEAQLARVDALVTEALERQERLHLNTIVLCETAWVLRSVYGFDRNQLREALSRVVATRQFSVENLGIVRRAVDAFGRGKGDFADYLIGFLNQQSGCRTTATFDSDLRGAERFRLL